MGGGVQGAKMVPGDDGEDGRGKVRRGGRKKMEGGCVRGRRSYRGGRGEVGIGRGFGLGDGTVRGETARRKRRRKPNTTGARWDEEERGGKGKTLVKQKAPLSLFCGVPILFGLSPPPCGDKTLDMCAVRGKGKKRVLSSYVCATER